MAIQTDKMIPPLLSLPLELRAQIYDYLLPHTLPPQRRFQQPPFIVWQRGTTVFLRTCSQVHAEASEMLYGTNTFDIWVAWDRVEFRNARSVYEGLTTRSSIPFLEWSGASSDGGSNRGAGIISARNQRHIRSYHVVINLEDSYTAMVKYNNGGLGFIDGLRDQVARLCEVLRGAEQLLSVMVVIWDHNRDPLPGQRALEPFRTLRGVRCAAVAYLQRPEPLLGPGTVPPQDVLVKLARIDELRSLYARGLREAMESLPGEPEKAQAYSGRPVEPNSLTDPLHRKDMIPSPYRQPFHPSVF
ncbi:MAG: hypothetical protein M1819_005185 [Sarea resinae]|nr:MAG: hypothetical protein M1819_005185 [Sarea resinae]